MSLSRIGTAQVITSLDDQSAAAAACKVWYTQCRESLLREFIWPWATKYAALALVSSTDAAVNQEWLYSYRYPTDCLFIRRLLIPPATTPTVVLTSAQSLQVVPVEWRQDADPYPIPFEVGQDDDGRLIYTDQITAYIKYTKDVTDTTQFATDFANVLAWRMATELSYTLAQSDARRDLAIKMYREELSTARANALNEQQRDNPYVDWNSEFTRARFNQW